MYLSSFRLGNHPEYLVSLAEPGRHAAVIANAMDDEPDEMRRLLDLGVDGIMTDRVEALRDVFVERGLWPPH